MPEDTEQFALAMNGKKSNLHKKDFLVFANRCGIPENAAQKILSALASMREQFVALCEDSLLPESMRQQLAALIAERISAL